MYSRCRSAGLSLIEMVIFIIVLGIGFSALILLYNQVTQSSVDPVVRKQVLALATSMLEEVQLRGFSYCDPGDTNVYTASAATIGPGGCAATLENLGPESTETRLGRDPVTGLPTDQFDNVNDYHGFAMSGSNPTDPARIRDMAGSDVSGLNGYSVAVSIQEAGSDFTDVGNTEALRITVTAAGPGNISVSLQGYRLRYAPNSP